jgi:hypothetical protein
MVACIAGCADSSAPPAAVAPAAPAVPAPVAVPRIEPGPALAQGQGQVPAANQQGAPAGANEPAGQTPAENPAKNPEPNPNKPRPILGKKTADIRDAKKEEAKGAQRANLKITGKDPITISGNAYISIVGRTEILKIKHSVDLFHAEHGRYPKDFKEFMDEIIHKTGVRLSQLPFYQEYAYDAEKHELVIYEYPDRKAAAGL